MARKIVHRTNTKACLKRTVFMRFLLLAFNLKRDCSLGPSEIRQTFSNLKGLMPFFLFVINGFPSCSQNNYAPIEGVCWDWKLSWNGKCIQDRLTHGSKQGTCLGKFMSQWILGGHNLKREALWPWTNFLFPTCLRSTTQLHESSAIHLGSMRVVRWTRSLLFTTWTSSNIGSN